MRLFKKKPYVPTGRVGLYTEVFEGDGLLNKGSGYLIQMKVEETEQFGSKSRVKILEVMGADRDISAMVYPLINNTYIPSNKIEWMTNV